MTDSEWLAEKVAVTTVFNDKIAELIEAKAPQELIDYYQKIKEKVLDKLYQL